jgi:hypothetical protein
MDEKALTFGGLCNGDRFVVVEEDKLPGVWIKEDWPGLVNNAYQHGKTCVTAALGPDVEVRVLEWPEKGGKA